MYDQSNKFDGGKYDPAIFDVDLVEAKLALIDVLNYGANKYSRGSWRSITPFFERYSAARDRHNISHSLGEMRDPESGLLHLAHSATNAMFLLDNHLKNNRRELTRIKRRLGL